jgi:heptaprenyl diphosphate synthase
VDDLLDLTGDPRLMGKPAGMDVAQGRGVGSAIAGGNGRGREPVEQLAEEVSDDPLLEVKRQLIADGAVEEGRRMISLLETQARAALSDLPPGPAVDRLDELLTFVVQRQN